MNILYETFQIILLTFTCTCDDPSHYQEPLKPPIPLMARLMLIKRQDSCMDRNMKNINISESQP